MIQKTVVIFGTFDNLHKGHLEFINQAKKQGEKLVAIVARNNMVKELKGKLPMHDELKRIDIISKIEKVDLVLLGDVQKGTYNILKKINPDIIYLGYDQQDLYQDLNKVIKKESLPKIKIIYGKPYEPEIFHSSILNKR